MAAAIGAVCVPLIGVAGVLAGAAIGATANGMSEYKQQRAAGEATDLSRIAIKAAGGAVKGAVCATGVGALAVGSSVAAAGATETFGCAIRSGKSAGEAAVDAAANGIGQGVVAGAVSYAVRAAMPEPKPKPIPINTRTTLDSAVRNQPVQQQAANAVSCTVDAAAASGGAILIGGDRMVTINPVSSSENLPPARRARQESSASQTEEVPTPDTEAASVSITTDEIASQQPLPTDAETTQPHTLTEQTILDNRQRLEENVQVVYQSCREPIEANRRVAALYAEAQRGYRQTLWSAEKGEYETTAETQQALRLLESQNITAEQRRLQCLGNIRGIVTQLQLDVQEESQRELDYLRSTNRNVLANFAGNVLE